MTSSGYMRGSLRIVRAQADAVVERILESAERLGRFPFMGHAGRAAGTYEWVIPGLPYILVYQVREDADLVIVTGVFHGAQNR